MLDNSRARLSHTDRCRQRPGSERVWAGYGAGVGSSAVYGEDPEGKGPNAPLFFPSGVWWGCSPSQVEPLDPSKSTEYVTHSWYQYSVSGGNPLYPFDGVTRRPCVGPEPPYAHLEPEGRPILRGS